MKIIKIILDVLMYSFATTFIITFIKAYHNGYKILIDINYYNEAKFEYCLVIFTIFIFILWFILELKDFLKMKKKHKCRQCKEYLIPSGFPEEFEAQEYICVNGCEEP